LRILKKNSGDGEYDRGYWDDLRRYCLGFIGMSIGDYNNITYFDLMLKIDGFNSRRKHDEAWARKIAYSSYISNNIQLKQKDLDIDKFWPLDDAVKGSKEQGESLSEKRKRMQEALKKRKQNG